jgi:HK97 gp10 family phage protein
MLRSRLPEIAAAIPQVMDEVEEAGAEMVARDAKARVHVRSGDLREAIHTDKQDEGTYVVAGNTEVFYGHMEELGTSHSAPHPFLVPALEENIEPIVRLAAVALRRL